MAVIRFKPVDERGNDRRVDRVLNGVRPEALRMIIHAELVATSLGHSILQVNYVVDGLHGAASYHPRGKAVDISTDPMRAEHKDPREFQRLLQISLGPMYEVLLEDFGRPNEHIHVEPSPAKIKPAFRPDSPPLVKPEED